ncbi:MAG TPA: hypothetical protein EYP22_00190 [Methanosarcinales archaeon]|nr:hypothetical protein [Methanosarcinales archaeon]
MQTKMASRERIYQGLETDYTLYEEICLNPNLNLMEYTKRLNWSYGKTQKATQRLLENGLIRAKGKIKLLLSPISAEELGLKRPNNYWKILDFLIDRNFQYIDPGDISKELGINLEDVNKLIKIMVQDENAELRKNKVRAVKDK